MAPTLVLREVLVVTALFPSGSLLFVQLLLFALLRLGAVVTLVQFPAVVTFVTVKALGCRCMAVPRPATDFVRLRLARDRLSMKTLSIVLRVLSRTGCR